MRFNAAQQKTYAAYLDAWIELANMPRAPVK
jgi:hypothetical protein